MRRERHSLLPYLHVSLVPHPYPHFHLHPSWHAQTRPLKGGGNRQVEEAVAEVTMAAGEEAVVAAVTLLFSPKGHGAGKGIRQGAHCRRAQLPHTHKATIPKSYRSQALYVLNVNPPLYTQPSTHSSMHLQRTSWQLQLQLRITHNTEHNVNLSLQNASGNREHETAPLECHSVEKNTAIPIIVPVASARFHSHSHS